MGTSGGLLGLLALVVADPVDEFGSPRHGTVTPARLVRMVGSELGQLVRGRLGVGRQTGTLAGGGQVLGVGLPVQRHRILALGRR
nr:hypothetical protein [Halomonas muralis]